jgi:hypothetical protein
MISQIKYNRTYLYNNIQIIYISNRWDYNKISEDLAEYIEQFSNFSDDAAPAPEVEIRVKIPSIQFYQKYLNSNKYIIMELKPNVIYLHCKPKYLLPLLGLEELEYMKKVPGIYEPM